MCYKAYFRVYTRFQIQADKQLARSGRGKPGQTLEKAAEVMMACFRVCAADR